MVAGILLGVSDGHALSSFLVIIIPFLVVQLAKGTYVDLLVDEFNYLATGNYPSEHVLVCGSVILQHDKLVKKGADIHHLLERRITLWQQGEFSFIASEGREM